MEQGKEQYNEEPQLAEQLAAELIATRQQLAAVQQQLAAERAAAQQAASAQPSAQQRYGQIAQSVEQFIEGKATVADVVKNVSANLAQDENLWKGAVVGAAAAVLLTSEPVRNAMGKTVDGLFPGLRAAGGAAEGSMQGGTAEAATAASKEML